MKKIIFLCVAILFANTVFAQFILNRDGFFDSKNRQNRYIVHEIPGKTQQELYDACDANFLAMRHTSDLFFDGIPCETITVSQYLPMQVFYGRMFGLDYFMDLDFAVTFRFKDGKVRVDTPFIKGLFIRGENTLPNGFTEETRSYYYLTYDEYIRSPYGGTVIYNRKGRLKEPKVRASLEEVINGYIFSVLSNISAQTNPDEW